MRRISNSLIAEPSAWVERAPKLSACCGVRSLGPGTGLGLAGGKAWAGFAGSNSPEKALAINSVTARIGAVTIHRKLVICPARRLPPTAARPVSEPGFLPVRASVIVGVETCQTLLGSVAVPPG